MKVMMARELLLFLLLLLLSLLRAVHLKKIKIV
jgi:hypothetical protein